MSARQAFIPRVPSCAPSSEPHPLPADAPGRDGDRDTLVNGKARSVVAFLGQRRGTGTGTPPQGAGPVQGPDLGRLSSSTNRRSFEGIRRPEMTPLSIIPYPATTEQLGAGARQRGAGQTPRKAVGSGPFAFPGPMTPTSVPRGIKKGFGVVAESREDEVSPNRNAHRGGIAFTGPGGENDVRAGAGTGIGGYMRVFEGSDGTGSIGGAQSNLEHGIIAPVPGYELGSLGAHLGNQECDVDDIFARSSRSEDTVEVEVGMDRSGDSQRSLGTKRGMYREDMDGDGRHTGEGHQPEGSAKRRKQVQHDPDEYLPISSPHIPPTPAPPTSFVDAADPSLVARSLFENFEEYVSLEEIDADWKRWRRCTTEEWLKGATELAQLYSGVLDKIKDHLTEKVLAYANMVSSIEERRTELKRDTTVMQREGDIVRENISMLGTKQRKG